MQLLSGEIIRGKIVFLAPVSVIAAMRFLLAGCRNAEASPTGWLAGELTIGLNLARYLKRAKPCALIAMGARGALRHLAPLAATTAVATTAATAVRHMLNGGGYNGGCRGGNGCNGGCCSGGGTKGCGCSGGGTYRACCGRMGRMGVMGDV